MGHRRSPTAAEKRLEAALDMYEDGIDLVRRRIAREHPGASRRRREALLLRWLTSRPLDATGRPRRLAARG